MARVVIPGFRKIEVSGGGQGGTTNYNELENKPAINNVPLVGNLRTVDLKLTDATLTEEGVPAESKTVGAKLAEQSTSLLTLKEQLGNHTVKSDVPENAVFTDTVYDDTEIKEEFTKAIDDIEIGGRNLYLNSKNFFGGSFSGSASPTTFKGFGNDESVPSKQFALYSIDAFNGSFGGFYFTWNKTISNLNRLKKDEIYTISFWIKSSVECGLSYAGIAESQTSISAHPSNWIVKTEWQKFEKTFKYTNNNKFTDCFYVNKVCDLYISSPKLEKGNKATDWTPAPEDTEAEIQAVDKKVTTNILKPTLATTTRNGITCTNNGDGTYTLNGTATSLFVATFGYYSIDEGKPYKLLCCPSGGSESTYYADWRNDDDGQIFEFGSGSVYTSKKGQSGKGIRVVINKGFTCDNLVFKPMLTTNLNATYDDFVPYTGDSGKLNSDVASLLKRIETLESLVNKTDTTITE